MTEPALKIEIDQNQDNKRLARRRQGTKTFLDIDSIDRLEDLKNSEAGKFMSSILSPREINLVKIVLEEGTDCLEGITLKQSFLSERNEQTASIINQLVNNNWKDPEPFEFLYHIRAVESEYDRFFLKTTGAKAIFNRLQSLIKRLPEIIISEREKQEIKIGKPLLIDNIGCGHALDTVVTLIRNPNLRNKVHVRCVDPDTRSMKIARDLVKKNGLERHFEFIERKIQDVKPRNAHILMMIGMFCPIPTVLCSRSVKDLKIYCVPGGIMIFSTVQEKMLNEGPLLDMTMELQGWHMYFKKDGEPYEIATKAGWLPEPELSWTDKFGFNQMTVARLNGGSSRMKKTIQKLRCLIKK